jgi:hypothetical protein
MGQGEVPAGQRMAGVDPDDGAGRVGPLDHDGGNAVIPTVFVPDLAAFARRWGAAAGPVALIRPAAHAELERMGVPMRVIYTSRSYVAVVRP